jgi:hypothetical protein
MTGKPEVKSRPHSQLRGREVGFDDIIQKSPRSPFLDNFLSADQSPTTLPVKSRRMTALGNHLKHVPEDARARILLGGELRVFGTVSGKQGATKKEQRSNHKAGRLPAKHTDSHETFAPHTFTGFQY